MSFVRYNVEDSVISSEVVVRPMWANDQTVFTDSNAINGWFIATPSDPIWNEYFLNIYESPWNGGGEVQFSLQYGNINGSGSNVINVLHPGYSPSRIIYGQYRNLVYGTETTNFSFDGGLNTAQDIYIINVNRSRYKQSIQPGSLNLVLQTGSNSITLTDDYNTTSLTRFIGENRIFYIISGSNGTPYTPSAATQYYGMLLPDLGVIILNGSGSNSIAPFLKPINYATSSIAAQSENYMNLYYSMAPNVTGGGNSFALRSQETVSSRFFFTRVKNSEFNYTSNPSIIDDNGNILYNELINDPRTYITTVGMYNDNNELLAVAKLSKPLLKDFTKEALIRIKLDY
jgi:hypothetical protein